MLATFLNYTLNLVQSRLGKFLTIIARPTASASMEGIFSDPVKKLPTTAIVMQGPIIYRENFTLETIKLYKKTFPDCLLIVSTWENENHEYLEKIRKCGAVVLENTFPPKPIGEYTINLQIVSTLAGILEVKRKKVEYILKTRTDQRLYGCNLTELFTNLLEYFPVAKGYKQKKRLLVHSFYTFKYRLYSVTDMNIFGTTEDILEYYSVPLDKRSANDKRVYSKLTNIFKISTYRIGEMYLATEYLQRIGRKLKWNLKDSWEVYRDHFIVVDQSIFDIYWFKYSVFQEFRHRNYATTSNKDELCFSDWFNLYSNFSNKIIPEKTQKHGFDEPVKIAYFKK